MLATQQRPFAFLAKVVHDRLALDYITIYTLAKQEVSML